MAAAGFDVGAGDSWAINEVTSAMRRGDGNSRANLREFLRGLYDAGGEGPPTKGVVWVVGIGQRVSGVGTYKARTQEWLQDSAFWSDVNAYVSDWSQEVYGDVRSYAAPGTATTARRDALVEYLRHADLLAGRGRRRVRHGERVLRRNARARSRTRRASGTSGSATRSSSRI